MAYRITTSLALGSLQTGLTLKAQLVDAAGANVGAEITTGFVEVGGGNYLWDYAAVPDGHRGGVKFLKSDDTLMAFGAIAPEDVEDIGAIRDAVEALGEASDPLTNEVPGAYEAGTAGAALGRIGTAKINVVPGPVDKGGVLRLIRGDDYLAEDDRAIEFSDAESQVKWIDLSGFDSVVLVIQSVEYEGDIVTPTGSAKLVRFELTGDQTATLDAETRDADKYAVQVLRGDSPVDERVTLVKGALVIEGVNQ